MGCGASGEDGVRRVLVGKAGTARTATEPELSPRCPTVSPLTRGKSNIAKVTREEAMKMFNAIDKNKNGTLSPQELTDAFKALNLYKDAAQMARLVEECDKDKGGHIDVDEFLSATQSVRDFSELVLEASAQRRALLFTTHQDTALPDKVLVNMLKAGGSVIMLRDNEGNVYKEMNNRQELEYYTAVVQSNNSFMKYLLEEKLIPCCKLGGFVQKLSVGEAKDLPPNEAGYYKQVNSAAEGTTEVIIMENLVAGMSQPAMCDFKIGSSFVGKWDGEPGFEQRLRLRDANESLNLDQISEILNLYKKYKSGKNTDGVSLKEITNKQLGIKTPLDYKDIKKLTKSWKHELRAEDSPVKELKFRCCGMRCEPADGVPAVFEFEPQKSSGKIKMSKPADLSPKEVAELLQDFCQQDSELATCFIQKLQQLTLWFSYNTEYRYYASSICFFYDMNDRSKCDVRWLDFAHCHRILQNDGTPGKFATRFEDPGKTTNETVLEAVNNLIQCIAPVIWKHR